MAWQKTGYQDSVEYDPDRHVLRYGTYEFHGKDVGLNRDTFDIDPSKVKSMDDVYLALGADTDRLKQVSTANTLYGGNPTVPFSGKDSWKNDAATQIWSAIKPADAQRQSVVSSSPNENLYGAYSEPAEPTRALSTQKLDTGLMQFTFADKVPGDYDFVNRLSSMANALSAQSGGDLGNQRPRRRTATGAF